MDLEEDGEGNLDKDYHSDEEEKRQKKTKESTNLYNQSEELET